FSLSSWKSSVGIDPSQSLTVVEIRKLEEILGIAPFLLDSPCQRYNWPYSPPINGWRSDCSQEIHNLPSLLSNMNCYIDQSCTAVHCCIDVNELGKSLEIGVKIDPCDFRLTVRIEKLSFDVTLYDYEWGSQKVLDLYGVMQISFIIENLYEEKLYLISLNASVNFDARSEPVYNVIMKNNLLPKAVCDWTSDFYIANFSLTDWLERKHYTIVDALPSNILYQLYEETNIGHYFLDNQCSRSNSSWTKGAHYSFSLQGIVRVEYSIEDLYTERYYLVNIRIRFCYESTESQCEEKYTILQNMKLPKQQCDWSSGFSIPGFSLESWYHQHSMAPGSQLQDWMISELLNDLGISSYLHVKQCSRHSSPFYPSNLGWNKGCTNSINLPQIPEPTTCYLDTSCTRVECCADVDFIPYSFNTYLHIDPCKQIITVGTERLHRNISFSDYQWGKQEELWLAGVLHLSFEIDDFSGESKYLVSLNMSICFESNKSCHVSTQILSNTWLTKALCAWDNNYYISNFSLTNWLEKENMSLPLPDYGQLLLFEDTGIAPYLQDNQCGEDILKFKHSIFTNACPLNVSDIELVEIPCHLSALCTGIECCVHSNKLNRDFHTRVLVDPCSYVVTVGIDNFVYNTSITEFSFGEVQQFSLAGIANIELIIYYLEKEHSYLVSKNISICTESQDTCEQNYVILENMMLPILQCSNNDGFIKEDFSLERWRNESGFSSNDSLTSVDVSELFEYIGLSYYLLSTRCNRSSDPYIPSVKGWNSLCINNEDLTNLTGPVSCNLDSICNKISCCVDVENLDRTIEISLSIDHCNSKLTLQLERLSIDVSLVDYKWGTQLEHGLVGVVNTETTIYNLAAENNYMVYMTVLVCLESNDTCAVDEVILDGVKFSKGVCDRSMENEFSLAAWLDEKGLPKSIESLPVWAEVQLKQELNIDKFLKPESCSHTLASSNGQKNTFGLFGIVKLEYILDKDSPETFSLHLDINVCFEPDNKCELEIEIYNETTVNRQHCDQAPGFLNSSFSLNSWLSDKSININSIDDATASDLITELGLSDYLGWSNKCNIYNPPFNGSIDGWSN
ncbi:Hypothetical predicted protein, partial [Mytilus galloprovincialis]